MECGRWMTLMTSNTASRSSHSRWFFSLESEESASEISQQLPDGLGDIFVCQWATCYIVTSVCIFNLFTEIISSQELQFFISFCCSNATSLFSYLKCNSTHVNNCSPWHHIWFGCTLFKPETLYWVITLLHWKLVMMHLCPWQTNYDRYCLVG